MAQLAPGRFRLIRVLTVLALSLGLPAAHASTEGVVGVWSTGSALIAIHHYGEGLAGTIVAIEDPVYTPEEDPERAGQARLDDNNPEASLRDRPIVGIDMLTDYRLVDGQWRGRIYDPESGNTYQSLMKPKRGKLELRGYIGMPMFGRTEVFEPVPCNNQILELLARVEVDGACLME